MNTIIILICICVIVAIGHSQGWWVVMNSGETHGMMHILPAAYLIQNEEQSVFMISWLCYSLAIVLNKEEE